MVWWVVDAVRRSNTPRIVLVVGHGADEVERLFAGDDDDLEYALQAEQLGTAHAVRCAAPFFAGFRGDVLVLAGDGPLIRPSTIRALLRRHRSTGAAATLATSVIDDPRGYGRVVRDGAGRFAAIVEQRNLAPGQEAIREVYPSYACFDAEKLFAALETLEPNPLSGEYYITEVPARLRAEGERVELVDAVPPEDVLSINTPQELALVERLLLARREVSPT
jgi:bifunctional UDP-N-acetylglucosamine pyrophosphorylase/glucosamine-1-phosphate N-acetyltransferase